jgi:uncharacterized protein
MPVHSAIYEGRVTHSRLAPRKHRFSYRVALCYLDLEELPEVLAQHPLWSDRPGRPVRFRRADYPGDPATPLSVVARATAAERLGEDPGGPVRLLAHLRTWGWCFNPISLLYCFAPDGSTLRAVVGAVVNTPWHDRHSYVVVPDAQGCCDAMLQKRLHVSPFMPMDQHYRFQSGPPGPRLSVRMANYEGQRLVHQASLVLERHRMGRAAMTGLLVRYPLMTLRVSAAIYLEAGLLACKGVPVHPHPATGKGRP